MNISDITATTLLGEPFAFADYGDRTLMVVNVASQCGLTPQYAALERLHKRYEARGFSVIGVPSNFVGQEPGSEEDIAMFCSSTYGITFPLLEKVEINGPERHPLYEVLTQVPDDGGEAGDVQWNFEKFLVAPGGRPAARFRPKVDPESPEVIERLEGLLPASESA